MNGCLTEGVIRGRSPLARGRQEGDGTHSLMRETGTPGEIISNR